MSRQKCPLCNKKSDTKRVQFTQTLIDSNKKKELNADSNWISACPWCFEKSVDGTPYTKSEDDNIGDVFRSFTHI